MPTSTSRSRVRTIPAPSWWVQRLRRSRTTDGFLGLVLPLVSGRASTATRGARILLPAAAAISTTVAATRTRLIQGDSGGRVAQQPLWQAWQWFFKVCTKHVTSVPGCRRRGCVKFWGRTGHHRDVQSLAISVSCLISRKPRRHWGCERSERYRAGWVDLLQVRLSGEGAGTPCENAAGRLKVVKDDFPPHCFASGLRAHAAVI